MDEERHELMMQVDGLKGPGCGETIREALRPVDPDVDVSVDLAHGRVRVVTRAQSIEIADALAKAGYEARAMTG